MGRRTLTPRTPLQGHSPHDSEAARFLGISPAFAGLSPAVWQVSYVLLTLPPLAPLARGSLDLHGLGTPPAFILSQDQTLRKVSLHSLA
jgi:hypothetical protein